MFSIYRTVGGKILRPCGSNHRNGSPRPSLRTAIESAKGTVASGWDAFDDEDLSFLESMEKPGSMEPTSTNDKSPMHHLKGTRRLTSSNPEESNRVISHSSETWTLTKPGKRLSQEKTHPSRPVPKALFSDTDPLIEAYADLNVMVTDSALVQLSNSSLAPISSNIEPHMASELKSATPSSTISPPPTGVSPIEPLSSFNDLENIPFKYAPKLLKNMAETGLQMPTPIQRHAIPTINSGRDMLAMAYTGTGKTAAYLVPLLGALMKTQRDGMPNNRYYPSVIILQPTRELVQQVYEQVRRLIHMTHLKAVMLAGGDTTVEQIQAMRGGIDLIVTTPGRLLHHVFSPPSVVKLDRVRAIVIDEADKMLDLGMEPELKRLLSHPRLPPPPERQTLMLSATMPDDVRRLAAGFLHFQVTVQAGVRGASVHLIEQRVEFLPHETQKIERLVQMLSERGMAGLTLVFANTIQTAKKVHTILSARGLPASLLHGDLPQMLRDEAMTCFKFGVTSVMVCSSLAERGVDIPDVSHVINFDVPTERDDYIHRIGRTGRAGRRGVATTLFTDHDESASGSVAEVMLKSGQDVPQWLTMLAARAAAHASISGSNGSAESGRSSRSDTGRSGAESERGTLSPSTWAARGQQALPSRFQIRDLDDPRGRHQFGSFLPSLSPSSRTGRRSSDLVMEALDKELKASKRAHGTMTSSTAPGSAFVVRSQDSSKPSLPTSEYRRGSQRYSGSGSGDWSKMSAEELATASAALLARWQAIIHGGPPAPLESNFDGAGDYIGPPLLEQSGVGKRSSGLKKKKKRSKAELVTGGGSN